MSKYYVWLLPTILGINSMIGGNKDVNNIRI